MARVVRLAFSAYLQDESTDIDGKTPRHHIGTPDALFLYAHGPIQTCSPVYTFKREESTDIFLCTARRPSLELLERTLSYLQLAAVVRVSLTYQRLLFRVDVDDDRDLTAVPRMSSRATMSGTYPPDSFSSLVCFIVRKNREEQKKPNEGRRAAVGQLYGCAMCELGTVPIRMLQHKPSERFCSSNNYAYDRCKYEPKVRVIGSA